jgi:hypothetical protein
MIVYSTLSSDAKITPEMKAEIEEAKKHPITYDEDCPELSEEQIKQFECMVRMRNRIIQNVIDIIDELTESDNRIDAKALKEHIKSIHGNSIKK